MTRTGDRERIEAIKDWVDEVYCVAYNFVGVHDDAIDAIGELVCQCEDELLAVISASALAHPDDVGQSQQREWDAALDELVSPVFAKFERAVAERRARK